MVQGTEPARVVNKVSARKLQQYIGMDTTNFIAWWVRMTIHRRTVAFRRHLPPNQNLLSPVGQSDKNTLLTTRDERYVEGLRLPKRRGLQLSHNQPEPKRPWPGHTRAHPAQWKYMMGSQTEYASYRNIQRSLRKLSTAMVVVSALWTRSLYKNIVKHMAYLNIVPPSYHCMHCSWCDHHFKEERNKIHFFNTWD